MRRGGQGGTVRPRDASARTTASSGGVLSPLDVGAAPDGTHLPLLPRVRRRRWVSASGVGVVS